MQPKPVLCNNGLFTFKKFWKQNSPTDSCNGTTLPYFTFWYYREGLQFRRISAVVQTYFNALLFFMTSPLLYPQRTVLINIIWKLSNYVGWLQNLIDSQSHNQRLTNTQLAVLIISQMIHLLVCLFVCSFSSHSRIFHSFGDVTIAGEGLQILTYAPHLWPLSSDDFLACHNYCDMGFIMVISELEDPWPSNLMPSVCKSSSHYLF